MDIRVTSLYDPGACLVCGDKTSSREKVACSPACSSRWNGWQHKVRRAPKMYRECGWCGQAFFRDYRRKGQRYCGRKCGRLAVEWGDAPDGPRAKDLAKRFADYVVEREREARREAYEQRLAEGFVCEGCGKLHALDNGGIAQRLCRACDRGRWRERGRASYERRRPDTSRKNSPRRQVERQCQCCGVSYTGDPQSKYCSSRCWPSTQRNTRSRPKRVRAAFVEEVRLEYLISRDAGLCQLCRKRVDRKRAVPHPKAPTIDHIVPLSQNGEHSRRNTQLACFACNCAKGPRSAGSQLRMFG